MVVAVMSSDGRTLTSTATGVCSGASVVVCGVRGYEGCPGLWGVSGLWGMSRALGFAGAGWR